MFGINYKNWIREGVDLKVEEYLKLLDMKQLWGNIEIGYVSADHERFMELYESGKCKHPKAIYRPGNTVITHFIPLSEDTAKQYYDGKIPPDEWERICNHTRQISRGITDAITSTLQGFGRLVALLPEREGWSHAYGAEVAGMGKFQQKEGMFYSENQIGYFGSVASELVIK